MKLYEGTSEKTNQVGRDDVVSSGHESERSQPIVDGDEHNAVVDQPAGAVELRGAVPQIECSAMDEHHHWQRTSILFEG